MPSIHQSILIALASWGLSASAFNIQIRGNTALTIRGAPSRERNNCLLKRSSRVSSLNSNVGIESSAVQPQKAKPREGPLAWLLDIALKSPLWKLVLVPQARDSMVKTAEANGINWIEAYDWISMDPSGPWNSPTENTLMRKEQYPNYYLKPFHGYESGNLCWKAAFEQELAFKAVGGS